MLGVQGLLHRPGGIHRKRGGQAQGQDLGDRHRQPEDQVLHRRMQDVQQDQGKHAPADGYPQADVPVDVQRLVGVVPVAHVKELLHALPGDVFQHSRPDHPQQEDERRAAPGRQRHQQHDHSA